MPPFPDEMSFIIVDDLYKHYDLAFEDSKDTVHVYCDRCDDVVCELTYDLVHEETERSLYGIIVDSHQNISD